MYPDVFREHVKKCKAATDKPFGVNLPLLYSDLDQLLSIIEEEGVRIIITSAGNPKIWTPKLKALGCTVLHVVASQKFALKAEEAGVDGLIAEGFEAGGHNGREEITTFNLVPAVASASQQWPGMTLVALDPGWVRTDMGGPGAPLDVATSVAGLRAVLDGLTPDDNGALIHHDGRRATSW